MQKRILLFFIGFLIVCPFIIPQEAKIESPSKLLSANIYIGEQNNLSLSYAKKKVLEIELLNFDFEQDIVQGSWEIVDQKQISIDNKWKPVYGETSEVRDHYNELQISLSSTVNKKGIDIFVRLYDEGIALKYVFNPLDFRKSVIEKENNYFQFLNNVECWVTPNAQGIYTRTEIKDIRTEIERPLVVNSNSGLYLALGEANLVDYARMKFKNLSSDKSFAIQSVLTGKVDLDRAGYSTPWRYVMVGQSPGKLLENNYFVLNLNEPCQIDDVSWIKPGKVLREVTLTTQGGLACVDFAARNNIQYVEFDAGWYGPEYSEASDASSVTVDTARSKGPLDLHSIIEYANQKNVGILLYVNKNALHKQLDEILPLYQKWGVKGLKFGFVDVGDQHSTIWLHHAIRKAAEYKLMVDIHDEYRPTGYTRTYPNLITQEGIRGDEESPTSEQALITMFTRAIVGAGDYTNCFYAARVHQKMGGKAAQMAKAVMLYSPWQFIYWYDRPVESPRKAGGAGGEWESIIDEKDKTMEFYKQLPTVWDETKVLDVFIGEKAVIARRSGAVWYVGMLGSQNKHRISLKLDFIDQGKNNNTTLYSQSSEDLKNNTVSVKKVDIQNDVFEIDLEKNAGAVLVIECTSENKNRK